MTDKKKIVFLSGTRADFGKLKPLISAINNDSRYDVHLFVTGMHMLEKYGGTAREILRDFWNVYMYNNQTFSSKMDVVLSNTVYGFSHYVSDINPDLIIIHGDRVEALAGAIVGSFNNIRVVHIEGGEVSGTIDEMIRHSISKLAHVHLVANENAKLRLLQMGEPEENVRIIGSPDIDIMFSEELPEKDSVMAHYQIDFDQYAILIYHPVTTEVEHLEHRIKTLMARLAVSSENYIVIYPNNDSGTDIIINEYNKYEGHPKFRFFPSVQFERFLVMLKNCNFIIGNSSSGIREAPYYCIPTINIGSRQNNRYKGESIYNVDDDSENIARVIKEVCLSSNQFNTCNYFGNGKSVKKFQELLYSEFIWNVDIQKSFIDRN